MLGKYLRTFTLLLFVVGCASSSAASGAKVGTITGTVEDTKGAPLASVTVTVTDDASKMTYVGTTGTDGSFKIPEVPVGSGEITLSTLPTGCGVPPAVPYTTTNNGGTKIVNLQVVCQ